uniref:Copper transport protein n=1 Tax=Heterorhabditis bacteriophora TaxID=37862 RepID=A0A1I7WMG9_HETBA
MFQFDAPNFLYDVIKCLIPASVNIESVAYASAAKKLIVVIDRETTKFELSQLEKDYSKMLELHPEATFLRGVIVTLAPAHAEIQVRVDGGFIDSEGVPYDYVCRYFAPWVGINEDPATGSAQCALVPFWSTILGKQCLYAFQSFPNRGAQFKLQLLEKNRLSLIGQSVTVVSGNTFNMDHGGRHMWMWFHTHINDSLLFKSWWIKDSSSECGYNNLNNFFSSGFHTLAIDYVHIKTDFSAMVWSCLVVATFAVILEAIKWFRWMICTKQEQQESWTSHLWTRSHQMDVIIFVIQNSLSYVLMLVFMTYSVWLCVSLCIGLTIGHYLFVCLCKQVTKHRDYTMEKNAELQ